jgi:hypothetical protein
VKLKARRRSAADDVGYFACRNSDGGRLVRVGLAPGVVKPPRSVVLSPCPVCGEVHVALPTWRRPTDRDVGIEPDLVVGDPA